MRLPPAGIIRQSKQHLLVKKIHMLCISTFEADAEGALIYEIGAG